MLHIFCWAAASLMQASVATLNWGGAGGNVVVVVTDFAPDPAAARAMAITTTAE